MSTMIENNSINRSLAIGLLVLALLSGAVLAISTVDEWEATEGVSFDADDGPEVILGTDLSIDQSDPIPESDTVDLGPEIRLTGDDGTTATYDGANGYVSLSDLSLTSTTEIDAEGQGTVEVDGSLDALEYRQPDVDDSDTRDLKYADGDLEFTFESGEDVKAVDLDTDDPIAFAQSNGGEVTLEMPSANGDRDVAIAEVIGGPTIDEGSAEPTGFVDGNPEELKVDVEDPDGGELDVTFEINGNELGSDTVEGSGTASVEADEVELGDNEWAIEVEDEVGNTETASFEFSIPSEIIVRDVQTMDVIDDVDVTVEFFSGEVVTERTTSDGTVDMEGLDPDEPLIITLQAEGYHERVTIIDSIVEQQDVYLLEDSDEIDDVSVVFELEDYSGQFDSSETQLRIERPVEIDGERTWQIIGGERFGAAGEVSKTLEMNQRYRLVIENEDGLTRSLGDYTPTEDIVTTLEVGSIEWAAETDTYRWFADYNADETGHNVEFILEADPNELENIEIELRDQLSEELVDDQSEAGPVSEHSAQFDIPEEYENRTMVIEWTAEKNGEEISGSRAIGDRPPEVDNPFEGPWAVLVVGLVLMGVGLLFGGAFGAIGALVVSMSAGVLWWLGWLEVGVGIVLLALLVSVLYVLGGER